MRGCRRAGEALRPFAGNGRSAEGVGWECRRDEMMQDRREIKKRRGGGRQGEALEEGGNPRDLKGISSVSCNIGFGLPAPRFKWR